MTPDRSVDAHSGHVAMPETCDAQRRLLLAGLGAAPLSACLQIPRSAPSFVLTLTGQALIAHDLCAAPYPRFQQVVAEIQRGDVAITDLETSILTPESGVPTREGQFLHTAGPDELACVRTMGFGALALANNHAGDLGPEGVLATREAVISQGFAAAGTGANLADASRAARFTAAGRSVALVAMATGKVRAGAAATETSPGVNEVRLSAAGVPEQDDVQRTTGAIRAATSTSNLVVAYLHNHDWRDDMRVTQEWTQEFAKACIDAGAHVFFAHGAPLLHGIEIYRGAPIFYCLGSLIFHSRTVIGHYPPEVWQSALAHVHFQGTRLQRLELIPIQLNEVGSDDRRPLETRGRPQIAKGDDAAQILDRLQRMSAAFGTEMTIARGRGYIMPG